MKACFLRTPAAIETNPLEFREMSEATTCCLLNRGTSHPLITEDHPNTVHFQPEEVRK